LIYTARRQREQIKQQDSAADEDERKKIAIKIIEILSTSPSPMRFFDFELVLIRLLAQLEETGI